MARDQNADVVFSAKVLYAYGQYQDLFIPSEQGNWLIKERNLVYMVSAKNLISRMMFTYFKR